jgi:hypothetical protein
MWVDNIKMDLRATEWSGMDLIEMAQDRDQWRALVNTVMKPSGSLKCWEFPFISHRMFGLIPMEDRNMVNMYT